MVRKLENCQICGSSANLYKHLSSQICEFAIGRTYLRTAHFWFWQAFYCSGITVVLLWKISRGNKILSGCWTYSISRHGEGVCMSAANCTAGNGTSIGTCASCPTFPTCCKVTMQSLQPTVIYTVYWLDEGLDVSGLGLFLIGGHWLKILLHNSKGAS
jgi:hypothetical protein